MYDFEKLMDSDEYADSVNGYSKMIDVDSFIDYFIINELSRNVDGYRLSGPGRRASFVENRLLDASNAVA